MSGSSSKSSSLLSSSVRSCRLSPEGALPLIARPRGALEVRVRPNNPPPPPPVLEAAPAPKLGGLGGSNWSTGLLRSETAEGGASMGLPVGLSWNCENPKLLAPRISGVDGASLRGLESMMKRCAMANGDVCLAAPAETMVSGASRDHNFMRASWFPNSSNM